MTAASTPVSLCSALSTLLLVSASFACADDGAVDASSSAETTDTTTGDGDSTETTGDGDSTETTGDGDGDSGDGDGDGDSGDGDGDPGPSEFWVGFDVRDIDPSPQQLGTIYLGGFGEPFLGGTATGVHDSIYARSIAIGEGDEGVVMTIVDVTGMGNQITRAIREQASQLTGLPPDHIIVASTHTHSGPDFQGLWGGIGPSYKEFVINETVGSMLAAWQTRVPAELSVSNSSALNNNRRDWPMTDDTIFVLQAHRKSDATLLGTMLTFAAHPVVIGNDNNDLSRDYCGYTVDTLEAATGGPVVLFNGILGDVSPAVPEGMYADDFERAEAYGTYVADQAALMIEDAVPVDPELVLGYSEWELTVDNVLFNLAGQLGILLYDFMQNGLVGTVVTQSTYIRLGTQAQIIAFPGESLTRNGLPIKDAMDAPYKAVLGNANDALGYFVPSDEWNMGHNNNYEETVSMHMSAGDISRDEIIELIEADVF